MKSLYLVDASSMFFRAFFALPHLTNSEGMPTNALYGFLSMTVKLLKDVKPDYLVYCFDRKEPSFRHEMYEDYKANRDEMPSDLAIQVPYMKQITEALGIMNVDRAGFEADDVIGCLAQWGKSQDMNVVIVSGDKDFAQLVDPRVTLYDTMKDLRTDIEGVKAKYGIRPDQMIDYLAIVGDSSDNVPGIRGIGPKGAQKLLSEYETLENIYENIEKIKAAGLKKKLVENKDMAFLSRKLVTIVCDLDLNPDASQMSMKPIDQDKVVPLLQKLGFKTFERTLFSNGTATGAGSSASAKRRPVAAAKPSSGAARKKAAAEWQDWETTLEGVQKEIEPYTEITALLTERGLLLAWNRRILPADLDPIALGKVLADKKLIWKGYHLKEVFKTLQIKTLTPDWDSDLAAYVLRADRMGDFDKLYSMYLEDALPPLASTRQILDAADELAAELSGRLKEHNGDAVLHDLDLPLIPVLTSMELNGVLINKDELASQSKLLADDLKILETRIFEQAGETFNIASPKQLGQILFTKLKLPPGRKTKTGFSTDSDVLEGLKEQHPIAALILDYRELSKLKSTYVDALPALINSKTGRVHTHLNQTATSTGRLSSTNPNLQNIPIRTERGRLVRRAFVADPGSVLISADYSQIELRVLAHITEDPALIAAFEGDLDIHATTASEIFGVPLEEITPDLRRSAKAVNFGIAYGQGAFGLAENLAISRQEAQSIIDRYFERFKNVKRYMEDVVRQALEVGYVETLFGRRRYIDELKSRNQNIRKFGERAAINAPIQGTASDLVKLAMTQTFQSLPIAVLLQVHDELLFECPADEAADWSAEIKGIMESVYPLRVPLKVNVAWGPNWEDAH